jgi:hypothetical protein
MTVKLVVVIPAVVPLKLLSQGMRQKSVAMIPVSAVTVENSRSAVVKIYSLIANQVVKN